jgi:hypothetical protein
MRESGTAKQSSLSAAKSASYVVGAMALRDPDSAMNESADGYAQNLLLTQSPQIDDRRFGFPAENFE